MTRYRFLALSLLLSSTLYTQTPYDSSIQASPNAQELPINRGSTALWQSLKKLHTRASLIMVTAHPDDEDGGMLAFESRGQGARVTLLTLNRGEGGANVMSSNYFDGLGLVRTKNFSPPGATTAWISIGLASWTTASLRPKRNPSPSGRMTASSTTWLEWSA